MFYCTYINVTEKKLCNGPFVTFLLGILITWQNITLLSYAENSQLQFCQDRRKSWSYIFLVHLDITNTKFLQHQCVLYWIRTDNTFCKSSVLPFCYIPNYMCRWVSECTHMRTHTHTHISQMKLTLHRNGICQNKIISQYKKKK